MWTWKIILDKLTVVRGFAPKKEECIYEAMHYASLYLEESFDKAVIEIKKEQE